MTEAPVRTVFVGSGGFGVPSLRALAADPAIGLVGVVTAPPRPAGRRRVLTRTPVHDAALDLGIQPILTPERLRSMEGVLGVRTLDADLLVLADYGRLVPPELLEPRFGALNLHPSLLPRHRGATPIAAAILAGDAVTGVTLMRMDAGLDTGPVIAQSRWALDGDETTPELEASLADEAAGLLARSLAPWLAGALPARPQAAGGATLTRPLRREDGRLDTSRPAAELERQVRAYQPWPGAFLETGDGRLLVLGAAVGEAPRDAAPGTVLASGIVVGGGTLLRPVEVRPAGGATMPWAAFLRGRPELVGRRLPG